MPRSFLRRLRIAWMSWTLSTAIVDGLVAPPWSDSNTPPKTTIRTAAAAALGTRSPKACLRLDGSASGRVSGSSGAVRSAVAENLAEASNSLHVPQPSRCVRRSSDSNSDNSPSISAEIEAHIRSHS